MSLSDQLSAVSDDQRRDNEVNDAI